MSGPTRRQLLGGLGALAAGAALSPAWAASAGASRRLVLVHAWGGWDITFAFDPKDRADVDGPWVDEDPSDPTDRAVIETLHGIPLLCDDRRRPAVTRFFEAWGGHTALVNGLQIGAVGHPDGVRRILAGTPEEERPDLTAIVGGTDDAGHPVGFVDLSGAGVPGHLGAHSARLGARGQLGLLLDPSLRPPPTHGAWAPQPPADARTAIRDYLLQRGDAERVAAPNPGDEAVLGDHAVSLERAEALSRHGIALPGAAGLPGDVARTLALLDQGVARAILLDSGQPWDSHVGQSRQHDAFDALFAQLDALVSGIVAGGHDDVVVAVVSEMGRSPRRNREGGTEHWPVTSALLLGAGVHGGRVLGATDSLLRARGIDLSTGVADDHGEPLRYDQFCAGLLQACGVDPSGWLPGADPFTAPYS